MAKKVCPNMGMRTILTHKLAKYKYFSKKTNLFTDTSEFHIFCKFQFDISKNLDYYIN